ncbi:MAG: 3-hydroxyacyl-CoA dehydrogenase NAD-binding domain-containing protein [Sphingomonadaceae bacterium]
MQNFNLEIADDGIATLTFDVAGRSVNTLTSEVMDELPGVIEQIRGDDQIRGVILRSGKNTGFCAGADLGDLLPYAGTRIELPPLSRLFRALETSGKPIVTVLEGLALGGGLELALATHYRIAVDSPKVKLGLPEVLVGVLPGAGGTQRLPRLIGIAQALPLLLEGRSVDAATARELGFVDEVVPVEQAIEAARRWLREKADPEPRWDKKDFKVPGGLVYTPAGVRTFMMANAMLRKKTFGNFPAPENILKSVFEGIQVPMDAALRIESRYAVNTFATPQARNMVRSLFISKQALAKGAQVTAAAGPPKRVAVIGAGMMGAGIAYVQAARGIETLLIDVNKAKAETGKDHARQLVGKAVEKGRMTIAKGDELLARIHTFDNYDELGDVDLVVEAVFENIELKHEVIGKIEERLPASSFFGSNTSTLPISILAKASPRPDKFTGIHFFSPVDKMELVEIIRGEATSEETIARAVAYAVALGKTPIVVNDSRGFYTSRCFGTYVDEGMEMLMEGIPPALIENAGRMSGMPRGPLELHDDVALDLSVRVTRQTKAALGDAHIDRPHHRVLENMVSDGRLGRKSRAGLYEYPTDGPKRLWSGLAAIPPGGVRTDDLPSAGQLEKRLLHRQAIEAARCFEERVVTDVRAADVGAIFGWGFAPWTGGPLSYIDMIGAARFVADCDDLAKTHGSRFEPTAALRQMAASGGSFYDAAPKLK